MPLQTFLLTHLYKTTFPYLTPQPYLVITLLVLHYFCNGKNRQWRAFVLVVSATLSESGFRTVKGGLPGDGNDDGQAYRNVPADEKSPNRASPPMTVSVSRDIPSSAEKTPAPYTVVLYPRAGLAAIDLAEVYSYRNLLYLFFWRDIKTRYKQSYLGGVWIVLSPLVSTAIYSILLGYLARFPSDGVPYPLYVLIGITSWGFFSRSLTGVSTSLADQQVLINKIYFPRIIAPMSSVLSAAFDFGIMLTLMFVAMLAIGVFPSPRMLLAFVFILQMALLAMGIGLILTGLDAVMRDVRIVLSLVLQVWYFACPIVYPIRVVPKKLLTYYYLNPATPLIQGFRWALLGGTTPAPPLWSLALSAIVTAILLLCGTLFFQKVERTIVDHI